MTLQLPSRSVRKQAFTLIELLVALAIIGVLVAILFPVFAAARRSARMAACSSNMRQIGLALHIYYSDYGRMPTEGFVDSEHFPAWKGRDPLEPYSKSGAVYHCPESGSELAGSYLYRAAFSLTHRKSGEAYISDNRTIRLQPTSVLAFCQEHSTIQPRFDYTGVFIVLRADTSVERIPAGKVVTWGYSDHWLQPPVISPPNDTFLFPVFPNEPWPPQFED